MKKIINLLIGTNNIEWGADIEYTISGAGINSADIATGTLVGSATITPYAGYSGFFHTVNGQATVEITLNTDNATEGDEMLRIDVTGASANVFGALPVRDTSQGNNVVGTDNLDLGEYSGINFSLLRPVTTQDGKSYYILDSNNDDKIWNVDYVEGVTDIHVHDDIDKIFGVVDTHDQISSRTTFLNNYRITMPTVDDLRILWKDSNLAKPPSGWGTHHYLTASNHTTGSTTNPHYIGTLSNSAGAFGIGEDTTVQAYVALEVNDLIESVTASSSSIVEGNQVNFTVNFDQGKYWKSIYKNTFDYGQYSPEIVLEGSAATVSINNPGGTIASYPKAMYFDGNGDGVVINNSSLSEIGTKNFKLSFVFKTDGTQDNYSVLVSRFESRDGNYLEIGNGPSNSTGGLYAETANTRTILSPLSDFNDDEWHYVEFFRQGQTLTLRVDGNKVNTVTGSTVDSLDLNGIRLGRWQGNDATDNNFKGWIDDFVVSVEESIPYYSSGVSYTISGIDSDDIVGGSLSGTVTAGGTNGIASITVDLKNDGVTEGQEALTLNIAGKVKSVIISDASANSVSSASSVSQVSEPTVPVTPGEAKGYTPIIFTNARLNLSAFPSLANFNIPQTILDNVLAVLEGREAEPHGLLGEDLNDPEALLNLINALQATISEIDAQRAALGSVAGTLDERMQVVAASQSGDISAEAADSPVVAATLLELIKAQIQSLIDEQLTALSNISEPVALELLNND